MHRHGVSSPLSPIIGQIAFGALAKTDDHTDRVSGSEPRTLDGFLGLSEDGFVTDSVVCNVPGGKVFMQY